MIMNFVISNSGKFDFKRFVTLKGGLASKMFVSLRSQVPKGFDSQSFWFPKILTFKVLTLKSFVCENFCLAQISSPKSFYFQRFWLSKAFKTFWGAKLFNNKNLWQPNLFQEAMHTTIRPFLNILQPPFCFKMRK